MRLSLTRECTCITQVDSTLTSFATALSEVSSVTDHTYGPDSIGVGETEISSLTDPTYGPSSRGTIAPIERNEFVVSPRATPNAGVDEDAIAMADAVVVGVGVDGGGRYESGAIPGAQVLSNAEDTPPQDGASDSEEDSATWTWDFTAKHHESGASPGARVLSNAKDTPPEEGASVFEKDSATWSWDFLKK